MSKYHKEYFNLFHNIQKKLKSFPIVLSMVRVNKSFLEFKEEEK